MASFLSGLAGAIGQGFSGYAEDKADALKQMALQTQMDRQAKADALAAQLGERQLKQLDLTNALNARRQSPEFQQDVQAAITGDDAAKGRVLALDPQMAPSLTRREEKPLSFTPRTDLLVKGKRIPVMVGNDGSMKLANGETVNPADVTVYQEPQKQEAPILKDTPQGVVAVGRNLSVRPLVDAQGQPVMPTAGGKSIATIRKQVATNEQALSVIDRAIQGVKSRPQSFGFQNMLPDVMIQRTDPTGVEARANVANIGSLVMHDRSGAAVTPSEAERLKPFIPNVRGDTPQSIITKLQNLRRMYEVETDALRDSGLMSENQGGSNPPPGIYQDAPTKRRTP